MSRINCGKTNVLIETPPGAEISRDTRDLARFAGLTFNDFRRMAGDCSLSAYEKNGFPDAYREGFAASIFRDIRQKLPMLSARRKRVLEIGPGCTELPMMLAEICERKRHQLTFIDSPEMLFHLPDRPFVRKVPGKFPKDCREFVANAQETFDAIVAYSVLHYVFPGSDVFEFVDGALTLLAPGGRLLIGDIPNVSKRKRFFASETGKRFHRRFMQSNTDPKVVYNVLEPGKIDDAIILSIMMRAQAAGFDAFLLPQSERLSFANRRDDLVIKRP